MSQSAMPTIGFIGLGRMGRPMAANLCKAGFPLHVFDLNPEAVAALERQGAHHAPGVDAIIQKTEIIVTMLPSSTEVELIALGDQGLLARGRAGQLLLDMSTVQPATTDRIAEQARTRGMSVVDAPVGRLATHAERGESLFMVGASETDFQRVKPLLAAMGSTIHHCGPVGSGIRTKLVNNYLAVVSCQLNAEALALSQRFGLDLAKTLEVIRGTSAVNGQLQMNWGAKVLVGNLSPGFTIDLAHKDLSLIVNAANEAKVPMPLGAAAREMFTQARTGAHAQHDFSAMVDALCESAGIAVPRLKVSQTP